MSDEQVLATFFGDEEFPIEWEDGQRELFWVHDDLHIPNPVSPMYADIGGWWLNCDYMFRRFATPFASDWILKVINGYVYTAAIPAQPGLSAEASEYGSRYTPVSRSTRGSGRAGRLHGLDAALLRRALPGLVARPAPAGDGA